jgi:O-antigen/teichoic acid export membrane protein
LGSEILADVPPTKPAVPPEAAPVPMSPPSAQPGSRSATILRNITSGWVVLVVNTAVSFILAPIVVNSLGSVYYGVWTLLNQFTGYLWLFDFGVRESVVKFVAQYHASGERERLETTVRTAISLYSLVSLAALAAVTAMVAALPYVFNIPDDAVAVARLAAFVTGANVAQSFLINVFIGVLMGLQRHYLVSQAGVCYSLLRVVGTYVVLKAGYGIVGLSLVYLGLSLAYAVLIVRFCLVYLPEIPLRPSRPVRSEVSRLLHYGKYVFLANVGDKVVFATDAIVIGMFLPIAFLTPYAIAGTLVDNMRMMVRAMGTVFNPLTSGLRAVGNEAALGRVLQTGAKGAMLVGLPICIGFITLGERFVSLWMGDAHAVLAGRVMTLLSIGYIVGMPYYTILGILNGLGAHRLFGILRIVEGLINLALSVVLVNVVGLEGVALGTAIPHAIIVGLILPRTLPKIFPVNLLAYYWSVYARPLVAAVPFAAACWVIRSVIQPQRLSVFLLLGILSLVTYAVPAWLIAMTADERAHLQRAVGGRRPS